MEMLDVGKLEVVSVVTHVPSKEELASHMPTLGERVAQAQHELRQTVHYIDHVDAVFRKEVAEAENARTQASKDAQLEATQRMLSKREHSFFKQMPLAITDADARNPGPSPLPEGAADELRRAICEHPTARAAVSTFTTLRATAPSASVTLVDGEAVRVAAAAQAASHAADEDGMSGDESPNASPAAPRAPRTRSWRESGIGTVKSRLVYAKLRRDTLRGSLEAIEQLRSETRWPLLRVDGDPHEVAQDWNKGLPTPPDTVGKFCAYCAQRSPPVLARHRFVECPYRQLAGHAECSMVALHALEQRLSAKDERVRIHLKRFSTVVARRRHCKNVLSEVRRQCVCLHISLGFLTTHGA